jgi:GR25 family glycosyltransferase involved in LPS biosynthesis
MKFTFGNVQLADAGFYVNLDQSADRKQHVENQIAAYQIHGLQRFEALTDELRQSSATKSQRAVFELAEQHGYEVIFVAEDDFDIKHDITQYNGTTTPFLEHVALLKDELATLDWDVFLFGCTPKTHLIPHTKNISMVHKSTGAWAYLIKRKAYNYILNHFSYYRDYLAIDDILPLLNFHGFKVFCASPIAIHHAKGFVSTLQPAGPVNYDNMIDGCYQKFFEHNITQEYLKDYDLERKLTIVIAGHFADNYLYYLRYLLHSLPETIKRCKFLVYYDHNPHNDNPTHQLLHYFYNRNDILTYDIKFVTCGLIDTFKNAINDVKTPYFMFLEHDWVFMRKDNIDFKNIIQAFDNHSFINSVYLNKDDNQPRGFELCRDIDNNCTPFELDTRVQEVPLTTTCRWSNNPCIHRTSKFTQWYNTHLDKVHNNVGHGQHDVEENMIPIYRDIISKSKWMDIRDDWGTYLYGNVGDGPYVAHTDASRRYTTTARSQPEINGDAYIACNPLPTYD